MNHNDPKSLLEVIDWKEQAYREVAHLPRKLALSKRIKDSARTVESLGFPMISKMERNDKKTQEEM